MKCKWLLAYIGKVNLLIRGGLVSLHFTTLNFFTLRVRLRTPLTQPLLIRIVTSAGLALRTGQASLIRELIRGLHVIYVVVFIIRVAGMTRHTASIQARRHTSNTLLTIVILALQAIEATLGFLTSAALTLIGFQLQLTAHTYVSVQYFTEPGAVVRYYLITSEALHNISI